MRIPALCVLSCVLALAAPLSAQDVTLIQVAPITGAKGIAPYAPTGTVIVSANYPTGSPHVLELFLADGSHVPITGAAGFTNEVKLASIESTSGGFTVGDIFCGNGLSGDLVRITNGGATILNPWINLPGGGNGLLRGSMTHDRTGVFGNRLVVVTTTGQVWLIASDGSTSATPLASVGVALEGVAVVPNDPARYGSLAGTIIAGGESTTLLYSIDPAGVVQTIDVGVTLEDIDLIGENQNFFGINFDGAFLVGIRAEELLPYSGDILLTQEFPAVGASGLFRLTWDGTQFVSTQLTIATGSDPIGHWEHVTFSSYSPPQLCQQDTDLDGTPDCIDLCPGDPFKIEPGFCGCGTEDLDTDTDGLCDGVDPDDDNDGVLDLDDNDPTNPFSCQDADGDGCDDCTSGSVDPASDGPDFDGDGLCDLGDSDDDNDGVPDSADTNPFDSFQCQDADNDGCDDCATGFVNPAIDGPDADGDGICDLGDPDDDNDGVPDTGDSDPTNPFVCQDADGDGCDDCSSGTVDPFADGLDTDGDGLCDLGDPDDDDDGIPDTADSDPLDPFVCLDADADGCDDCSSGTFDPANDGLDTDSDGQCNTGDPDDDNDGVPDSSDADPLDKFVCLDADADGCDDCASGTVDPSNDGLDTDGDGVCDAGDPDDDNDGVPDVLDSSPTDPFLCQDADNDGCDDCSSGTVDPQNDGTDTDGDGLCDTGDPDDDNDGVPDAGDSDPLDPFLCQDADNDGCDDCSSGTVDPQNDGTDTDGDGICDIGDSDTDNDGVPDTSDSDPLDPFLCQDADNDGCDDCSSGTVDPANDGTDSDGDGTCDLGDGCPNDPAKTQPGICGCGVSEVDTDQDGTADCLDGCPTDPDKVDPGLCGCGVPDVDTDVDGTPDCVDGCPLDPLKTSPGQCGCGVLEIDTDFDGTPDCVDGCPFDPAKTSPGECGCGFPDEDVDGDGITDCLQNTDFLRGDANADAQFDIGDPIFTLNWLFQGGPPPICLDAADSNDDETIDVSDSIYTISYLFNNGAEPALPFPDCGEDGTPDDTLTCEEFEFCP